MNANSRKVKILSSRLLLTELFSQKDQSQGNIDATINIIDRLSPEHRGELLPKIPSNLRSWIPRDKRAAWSKELGITFD